MVYCILIADDDPRPGPCLWASRRCYDIAKQSLQCLCVRIVCSMVCWSVTAAVLVMRQARGLHDRDRPSRLYWLHHSNMLTQISPLLCDPGTGGTDNSCCLSYGVFKAVHKHAASVITAGVRWPLTISRRRNQSRKVRQLGGFCGRSRIFCAHKDRAAIRSAISHRRLLTRQPLHASEH